MEIEADNGAIESAHHSAPQVRGHSKSTGLETGDAIAHQFLESLYDARLRHLEWANRVFESSSPSDVYEGDHRCDNDNIFVRESVKHSTASRNPRKLLDGNYFDSSRGGAPGLLAFNRQYGHRRQYHRADSRDGLHRCFSDFMRGER